MTKFSCRSSFLIQYKWFVRNLLYCFPFDDQKQLVRNMIHNPQERIDAEISSLIAPYYLSRVGQLKTSVIKWPERQSVKDFWHKIERLSLVCDIRRVVKKTSILRSGWPFALTPRPLTISFLCTFYLILWLYVFWNGFYPRKSQFSCKFWNPQFLLFYCCCPPDDHLQSLTIRYSFFSRLAWAQVCDNLVWVNILKDFVTTF